MIVDLILHLINSAMESFVSLTAMYLVPLQRF